MTPVDVVVVSYNSRDNLRACVRPLATATDIAVCVVDNASGDRSLDVVSDLGIKTIPSTMNGGFAYGCNLGWRSGSAPHVLFVNPDATIDPGSIRLLGAVLDVDARVGAVAPLIRAGDGTIAYSQRRFPTLPSTFGGALFLNRVFPGADWTSELVRDAARYEQPGSPDWVSGACVLLRRSVLEEIGGWDDGFFLYCEDKDLCRRVRDAGYDVRFEPAAVARHAEGASSGGATLMQVLAESRIRYARKHAGALRGRVEQAGVALDALTHAVFGRGGPAVRRRYAAAFRVALRA